MGTIKTRLGVVFAIALSVLSINSATVLAIRSSASEGYTAKGDVRNGSLVSLFAGQSQAVEMSSPDNRHALVGVAIKPEQSLVAITDGANRVQVVTNGLATAQVSTANGAINAGDYLSISPISGVAMKATSPGKVIGVAQQDFDVNPGAGKDAVELTDDQGAKRSVLVGTLVVKVEVADWAPAGQPNSPMLNNLRTFLGNAVGKPVSNIQALLAVGVILVAALAAGTIMYSAVSSSIKSIGRNPLSKGIIRRSLFLMLGLSAIVIVGAASAVYLILGG